MSLEEEISAAIRSHERWKAELIAAIDGSAVNGDLADVGRDDHCHFGRWLYGPTIPTAARFDPNYIIVQFLHSKFHQCAGRVVQLLSEGKQAEARALMADDGEYTQMSDQLVTTMMRWQESVHKAVTETPPHRNKTP